MDMPLKGVSMLFFADDPFRGSWLARSAMARIAVAAFFVACLWLAIVWAVSLP
jgi:hypothetical protein